MKKILVINTSYRNFGGEDSNIKDELRLLNKKYQVEYLEYKNSGQLTINDIFAFIFRTNKNSNKILEKKIKEFKPDIAYVHNTWFRANLGIFEVLTRNNILILHKIHNFRYFCTNYFLLKNHLVGKDECSMCGMSDKSNYFFNKYFKDSYLRSIFVLYYAKKYFNILIKNNLKILALNSFHKNFLIKQGISKSKIYTFYNPTPVSTISKNQYNFSSKNVIFAGRLTEEKGLQYLLKSWCNSNIDGLKLMIIGTGPLEQELKKDFADKNVVFMGMLSNEETKNLIKNSRAVITCTRLNEGQPLLLSEASVFGVPSIYPSFGGMDEYFPNRYELAFEQFNYKDLIKKIEMLNDINLMKKLSEDVYVKISNILNEDILLKKFNSLLDVNE